jgi:hypothetical protein
MTEGDRLGEGDDDTVTDADPDEDHSTHVEELADGCGCAEVWEHLSEQRGAED